MADKSTPQSSGELARIYSRCVSSFQLGKLRLIRTLIVSARVELALYMLNNEHSGAIEDDNPYSIVLKCLRAIEYSSFDSSSYVTTISLLIYATTLLDTFLTETTIFLFLLYPHSIGKNCQVSLKDVISSSSTESVLTEAARKRAREISYGSFLERIDALNVSFGLDIELDAKVKTDLEHYASLRNVAVHDQGIYEYFLDEERRLASSQKLVQSIRAKLLTRT